VFLPDPTPGPASEGTPISGIQLWRVASTAAGFLVALALAWIFPTLTYYSLLVLLLTYPLDLLIKPRIARREAARRAK
jgi:hypothetical protein